MGGPEFIRQIRKAWDLFHSDLGIGRANIWTASLPVDEVFRRTILQPESTYAEIYRSGLSQSAYNFILDDYSYFQFSWETEQDWRMAYFPNPWITGVANAQMMMSQWEAMEEMGDLSIEDASDLIDGLPYHGAVPPIRFEYSHRQYREVLHPAAHLHLGRHSENRWPSAILMGPSTFSMMIAQLYYPEQWQPKSSFNGYDINTCLDRRFMKMLSEDQSSPAFSGTERLLLHISRNTPSIPSEGPQEGRGRRPNA